MHGVGNRVEIRGREVSISILPGRPRARILGYLSEYPFFREFPRLADLVLWQISFDLYPLIGVFDRRFNLTSRSHFGSNLRRSSSLLITQTFEPMSSPSEPVAKKSRAAGRPRAPPPPEPETTEPGDSLLSATEEEPPSRGPAPEDGNRHDEDRLGSRTPISPNPG